jgi:hypothetical protein
MTPVELRVIRVMEARPERTAPMSMCRPMVNMSRHGGEGSDVLGAAVPSDDAQGVGADDGAGDQVAGDGGLGELAEEERDEGRGREDRKELDRAVAFGVGLGEEQDHRGW